MTDKVVINTLLEDLTSETTPKSTYRVLYIDPSGNVAFINIWEKLAEVEWLEMSEIYTMIKNADLDIKSNDPYLQLRSRHDDDLSDKQKRRRDENYHLLKPIIEHGLGITIYHRLQRSKIIVGEVTRTSVDKKKYYFLVRRWLQRGQSKNALIPDFHNIGNKGQDKPIVSSKKRGRPRNVSALSGAQPSDGINISPTDVKKYFVGLRNTIS